MNREQIEDIIKIAEKWDLDALEVEDKNGKVKVVRRNGPVAVAAPTSQASQPATPASTPSGVPAGLHAVCSPMVGVFLAAAPETDTVLATQGKTVRKGDALGFVEAMKMQTEIMADVDGELVELLVSDQQAVEFNQPLFLIKPRTGE